MHSFPLKNKTGHYLKIVLKLNALNKVKSKLEVIIATPFWGIEIIVCTLVFLFGVGRVERTELQKSGCEKYNVFS